MSKLSQITAVIANAVCAALCGLETAHTGKLPAKAEMPTVIDAKALVSITESPVSFSDDNDKP